MIWRADLCWNSHCWCNSVPMSVPLRQYWPLSDMSGDVIAEYLTTIWTIRGSISGIGKFLFVLQNVYTACGAHPPSFTAYRGSFLRGREAWTQSWPTTHVQLVRRLRRTGAIGLSAPPGQLVTLPGSVAAPWHEASRAGSYVSELRCEPEALLCEAWVLGTRRRCCWVVAWA